MIEQPCHWAALIMFIVWYFIFYSKLLSEYAYFVHTNKVVFIGVKYILSEIANNCSHCTCICVDS